MYWISQPAYLSKIIPFLGGWLGDRILGDPEGWPHPVVAFGKAISYVEKKWNQGNDRALKGTLSAIALIAGVFILCLVVLNWANRIHPYLETILIGIGVFYCLAGKTLVKEVKAVFEAVDRSTEEGRQQVGRIVGRDTSSLSPQEIRAAALETLAENLSDGVIAPMFWFALLGLPGMMAYKMVNTLDSMIGYKNERYIDFGRTAARLDDIANYIPARITAWLMLAVSGNLNKMDFVKRFGPAHASPNSGYPESALAAILDCRFGGTHDYFGKPVEKPYIGTNERTFTTDDMLTAIQINNNTELAMGLLVCLLSIIIH
ncbi:adenosylcobinamide-phosphate synthase CbiB [Parabacteroides sp. APC149_11_2_Y6]